MDYRRDIDGLRALAVVPVVLYHAPGEFVTGGFVGVDVFFVISGYLITRILLRELAVGRFSLLDFYERRARRILPALVAVLVFTTVVSFFVLLPAEFRNFGQSLGATMLFVSNFFFWLESNYFAGAAEFRPLLHTWSLAVEEQFYILHPLLLAGLFYVSKVRAVLLFTGIIVLSFIASVWAVANYPSAAFYLLPFRAWELGVGALLAFHAVPKIGDPRLREIAGIVGLALVAYAVVAFDSTTPFPGAAALLPCLGAALLIHAGSSGGCAASRLLALPPLVAVGLISYSLYLWHWPVFVLQSLYLMREPTVWEGAAAIAFAAAMAVLSWRYVEQPFRRRRIAAGRAPIFVTATTSIVAGLVLGGILHLSGGMPSRLAPEARELAHVGPFTGVAADECFAPPAAAVRAGELCRVGAAGEPNFLIWGDSHARAMGTAIDEAASAAGVTGVLVGRPGCAPLVGVRRPLEGAKSEACYAMNEATIDYLAARDIERVVLIARWAMTYDGRRFRHEGGEDVLIADGETARLSLEENRRVFSRAVERTVDALRALDTQVVVVGPAPEIGVDVPAYYARAMQLGRPAELDLPVAAFEARSAGVEEDFARLHAEGRVQFHSVAEVLCDERACPTTVGGKIIYRDDDHLNTIGARHVVDRLALFEARRD